MTEATPRPWRVPNKHPRRICDARGFLIAKCMIETKGANFVLPEGEAENNAALIARAVNQYDAVQELIEAARALSDALDKCSQLVCGSNFGAHAEMSDLYGKPLNDIRAALNKLENTQGESD